MWGATATQTVLQKAVERERKISTREAREARDKAAKDLSQAIIAHNPDEVERLLATPAYDGDVNLEISDWLDYVAPTMLWLAVVNRDVRSARLLLDKKADINVTVEKCGHTTRQYESSIVETPLARACRNGHDDMVKLLMDYGADPGIACLEQDFGGRDANIEERNYIAKDRCKLGTHHLQPILEDYTQKKMLALQSFTVPAGMLENDDETCGGTFLSFRLAVRLLTDLLEAGQDSSAREGTLTEWGFSAPREAEVVIRAAIDRDRTGKLQTMLSNWQESMLRMSQ